MALWAVRVSYVRKGGEVSFSEVSSSFSATKHLSFPYYL